MRPTPKLIIWLALVAVVSGCLGWLVYLQRTGVRRKQAELLLYCGAGIRPATDALIQAFERKHNTRIIPTYAGSGKLLGQIVALQKGDLFIPGAELYVDKAIEKDLAHRDSKRIVAYFVPVILVQKGNPKEIHSLDDFRRAGVRLGLGDERSCAVGKKTLMLLAKNGLAYADIEKNVVYTGGTVNELGVAIQLRNVDAIIVWDANARHFAKSGDTVLIAPEKNVPSAIPIVVLKSSRHTEAAREFVRFVTSAEGRRILTERGYTISLPNDAISPPET